MPLLLLCKTPKSVLGRRAYPPETLAFCSVDGHARPCPFCADHSPWPHPGGTASLWLRFHSSLTPLGTHFLPANPLSIDGLMFPDGRTVGKRLDPLPAVTA